MRMLRWTCGETRRGRVSNRHIRGFLHVTEVARKVKERRLVWFGLVERREEEHYLKCVSALQVPGRRRAGRPRMRWKDCVSRDMREAGLNREMAQDRNKWRRQLRDHFSDPV
ncbi:uncharacterized protein LOC134764971 [Penaeus indicus]|uniref:uncharacterized protein LOC134764971 n=1 Tax=Penaeus indicus TaxID=29960 RepID=UPI00300C5598